MNKCYLVSVEIWNSKEWSYSFSPKPVTSKEPL